MVTRALFRSKVLAVGVIAAFALVISPLPTLAQSQAQAPAKSYVRQGSIRGVVFSEGMKSRVAGATVKVRNLNNQKEFTSAPTDPKGNYRIVGVEEGWYTMTVTTPAGDFNLNYGVYIKAGEVARISVEMLPGGMLEGKGGGGGGKSFLGTPGGILLIVAAAGGAGFGIYQLTKKEEEVSPIR